MSHANKPEQEECIIPRSYYGSIPRRDCPAAAKTASVYKPSSRALKIWSLTTMIATILLWIWAAAPVQAASNNNNNSLEETRLHYMLTPPPPTSNNQTSSYRTDEHDFYDSKTWTLWTDLARDNEFHIQPYVANGYIGSRLPVQGQGFAIDQNYTDKDGEQVTNGWPLFNERYTGAYIAGFWDTQKNTSKTNFPELLDRGYESVVSSVPQWTGLQVRDESGRVYSPDDGTDYISAYYQGLNLKQGMVQTNVTWTPHGNKTYQLNYTVFAHRTRPNLGVVRLDMTVDQDSTVDVSDILDGAASMRTNSVDQGMEFGPAVWTAVSPHGTNVTAYEYSQLWFSEDVDLESRNVSEWASTNESTASQMVSVRLKRGKLFTAIKYVGVGSSDAYPHDTFVKTRQASDDAVQAGWDTLIDEHTTQWQNLWDEADIEVPGDEELQISARASLYHLLANLGGDGPDEPGFNDNSVAVGGLSSDSYGGQVFWDADVWMYPGVAMLHPTQAKTILNYRTRLRDQALENARSYNLSGAAYPWTSARWGNCTGTGPCVDYQYHLNIDIALTHWNYYKQTNDTDWLKSTGYPIMRDAAEMFTSLVKWNKTQGWYETHNLTDPDEYANHVNNGGYTNGAIEQLMNWTMRASELLGEKQNPKWKDISTKMKIPENKSLDLTLEADGMNGTAAIKQADIVMLQYPIEFPQTPERALTNLDYYAERQSPDGPAMTYAIFAIDKAEISTEGCSSYTYLNFANQPYMRQPFYQFSEQLDDNPFTNGGTRPAFPFLTGHGGYLQVYTHGLTGYRPREDVFYLDPSLPPQIADGVKVKGFKFQGGVFDISIGPLETEISRRNAGGNSSGTIVVEIGDRNDKSGRYEVKPGKSIKVPTYRADSDTMVKGNRLECKPVYTEQPWVAGNFPFGINDGDNSTYWQPTTPNKTEIMLDMGKAQEFTRAYFLWGKTPPKKVSVGIPQGNHGDNVAEAAAANDTRWVLQDVDVKLSSPWSNKTNASIITMNPGNESWFDTKSKFQARFVKVSIEGTYEHGTDRGGRVAEMALV